MFRAWKEEKAVATLVEEARAVSEKLATAKPHFRDAHAAEAQVWVAKSLAEGQDLYSLSDWHHAAVKRFASSAKVRIAALRKAREYDSSDGLAIWLHTARAVLEPRIAPAVRDIWQHLMEAGPNAQGMAEEKLQEAGLPEGEALHIPKGFAEE
jgi:hypothetical protein